MPHIQQAMSYSTSLYINWTSSVADDYILYYWKESTPSNVYTATTTSTSYSITGLISNTAYKIVVSARNTIGSTNSSEVTGYTTPDGNRAGIHTEGET